MKDEMKTDLRKRTKEFALRNIRLFASLPKRAEAQVLGKQLLRSATSVGANYREANRARSDSEFIAKIGICLQELDESGYWMELLVESAIVPAKTLQDLQDETDQLLAILTTISKNAKKRLT